jgi:hypothetical protein
VRLLHRTTLANADEIERVAAFTDGQYDSFGRGVMGVYFCTADNHAPGNPALFEVEIPDEELLDEWSDPCPPNATDWRVPAHVVNRFPRSRLQ